MTLSEKEQKEKREGAVLTIGVFLIVFYLIYAFFEWLFKSPGQVGEKIFKILCWIGVWILFIWANYAVLGKDFTLIQAFTLEGL